jgi:hypothetical protein
VRLLLAFAACFVFGVAGTGYVVLTAPDQATGPHTLQVTAVSEVPENATVTDAANLSEADRRLVETAVEGNGSVEIDPDRGPVNATHVRSEGTVYELRVLVGDPSDEVARAHLLAVAAGGLTAVVSALGLVGLLFRAWQRDRQRA